MLGAAEDKKLAVFLKKCLANIDFLILKAKKFPTFNYIYNKKRIFVWRALLICNDEFHI